MKSFPVASALRCMCRVSSVDLVVWWCGGRESIFLISHTNSFAEFGKVAHETGVACEGQEAVRRSYEKGPGRGPGEGAG